MAVVAIFGSAIGWYTMPQWLIFLQNPELQALIVMILVFGIIIAFITKEDKKDSDKEKGFGKFWDGIGEAMKKKDSK